MRAQVAALEREQKARATRFARDVVDRSLVDFEVCYPHFADVEKRANVQKRVYRAADVKGHA